MEHVEKSRDCGIACVAGTFAHIGRQVRGQRTVRAEKPEEIHRQAAGTALPAGRVVAERGRVEDQLRILRKAHGVVTGAERAAEARTLRMRPVEEAQRLEEVEAACVAREGAVEV
jgi:alkyl hydroperoxide reductase subunit AhpC